jgi:Domain of unknown function (DUF4265)
VARWRGGTVELLPDASTADQTVWFAVDPGEAEDHQDAVWEGLLTRPSGPDRAVVVAVPVFAHDVNLGDEVEVVASAEGPLVGTRVVRDAGQFTFRVLFPVRERLEDDERWRELQVDLEPYGCWFDVYSRTFIAVSAEPGVAHAVADFLSESEQAGRLQYETGRSAGDSS